MPTKPRPAPRPRGLIPGPCKIKVVRQTGPLPAARRAVEQARDRLETALLSPPWGLLSVSGFKRWHARLCIALTTIERAGALLSQKGVPGRGVTSAEQREGPARARATRPLGCG